MKLLILLCLFIIFSCNSKKVYVPVGDVTENKYVAIITYRDSSKVLDVCMLQTKTKFDSVKKIQYIDSVGGIRQYATLRDSLGREIIDPVTKKPKIDPREVYIKYPLDSIRWNIQGIPFDSLMKKTAPTH